MFCKETNAFFRGLCFMPRILHRVRVGVDIWVCSQRYKHFLPVPVGILEFSNHPIDSDTCWERPEKLAKGSEGSQTRYQRKTKWVCWMRSSAQKMTASHDGLLLNPTWSLQMIKNLLGAPKCMAVDYSSTIRVALLYQLKFAAFKELHLCRSIN